MKPRNTPSRAKAQRLADLRQMLEQRLVELRAQVADRRLDVRTESNREHAAGGYGEYPQVDVQADVSLALMQLQSQMLAAIEAAIARLEQGRYGVCVECEGDISQTRLAALPFAVRCIDCEEAAEQSKPRSATGVSWHEILN